MSDISGIQATAHSVGQSKPSNEQNTILFRVDANSEVGAGHLMRCIALAFGFQHYQITCVFLVDDGTNSYLQGLQGFPFNTLQKDAACLDEIDWIQSVSGSTQAIGIVLDGYQFSETYREKLSGIGLPVVAIDDTNTVGKLFADVVINPVSSATGLNYVVTAPDATLLLGSDYILLRPEFINESLSDRLPDELPEDKQRKNELYQSRQSCLISFGASDASGLTIPVLDALRTSQLGDSPITVVTGGAYSSTVQLRALVSDVKLTNKSITHLEHVSNMAPVLRSAKMAISAAGGTVFELAAMGVPTILLVVADNQLGAALEQQEKGWCHVIDARQSLSMDDLISAAQCLWTNNNLRLEMHHHAIENAVTDGAQRAAGEIVSHIQESVREIM